MKVQPVILETLSSGRIVRARTGNFLSDQRDYWIMTEMMLLTMTVAFFSAYTALANILRALSPIGFGIYKYLQVVHFLVQSSDQSN